MIIFIESSLLSRFLAVIILGACGWTLSVRESGNKADRSQERCIEENASGSAGRMARQHRKGRCG
jgi:hypothetical protein